IKNFLFLQKINKIKENNSTILELYEFNLTTIPSSIGQLTNLNKLILELYLHYNKLTTIPSSIGQLIKLNQLDLSHNQLITFSSSIIQLTRLTYLNIQNNSQLR